MRTNSSPRGYGIDDGESPNYNSEGFLLIQNAIAKAFIKVKSGIEMPQIQMQRFPSPSFFVDTFLEYFDSVVSVVILACFLEPCINIARFITIENEKQLKEVMKIMGLPTWIHWTGWFVHSIIHVLVIVSVMVAIFKVKKCEIIK